MSPQRNTGLSRQAFTLLEILAAVSIVVVLAALLMSGLPATKGKAEQIKCLSNLRQIVVAANLAAADNSGRYPKMKSYPWEPNFACNAKGTWDQDWDDVWNNDFEWMSVALAPYIEGNDMQVSKVFRCPGTLKNKNQSWLWGPEFTHYRYNVFYAQDKIPLYGSSQAMLFFDTIWRTGTPETYSHSPGPAAKLNVAYADGHIGTLTYQEYQALNPSDAEENTDFFRLGWAEENWPQ